MMIRSFTEWLASEKDDVFGFDRRISRTTPLEVAADDKPIQPLNQELFLGELASYSLGVKAPKWDWADHIEWGSGESGTIRLEVSPIGSSKIFVRKKMEDLTGAPTWICKRIIPINPDISKQESILAQNLYEDLKTIDTELLEMPQHAFNDLEELVVAVANRAAMEAPPVLIYNGIRMLEENAYSIYFSLSGHGVEAPGARQVEQFNIDLSFSPRHGMIRCFAYEISSPKRGHKWEPRPSEWDEMFVPTQSAKEIENAILNALSTY